VVLVRVGWLQPEIDIGIELTVIAAVVPGGTRLSDSSGIVVGSVLGAVFPVLIGSGLNLLNTSPCIRDRVRGGALPIAVNVAARRPIARAGSCGARRPSRCGHRVRCPPGMRRGYRSDADMGSPNEGQRKVVKGFRCPFPWLTAARLPR